MQALILPIVTALETISTKVPLEIFAIFGTFVEEVLAPIPSPLVLSISGSLAALQHKSAIFLLWIAILGAIGRIFGALVLYFLGDKAEDLIVGKLGKLIGLSHTSVENIGKKFTNTTKDYLTLGILRAIPVIPSSPISATCGIIKLNLKVFVTATFFGSIIRNLFYLYLGYSGLMATAGVAGGLEQTEKLINLIIAAVLLGAFIYLYRKRQRGTLPKGLTIEDNTN